MITFLFLDYISIVYRYSCFNFFNTMRNIHIEVWAWRGSVYGAITWVCCSGGVFYYGLLILQISQWS